MYGIIGEEASDTQVIKVIIRNLTGAQKQKCLCQGYSGDGELFNNGARDLRSFKNQGCTKFVVCYDADGPDPSQRDERVIQEIIRPAGIESDYCVVIPVQELEAWILADIQAVSKVFTGWKPSPFKENPEGVKDPKERLISENRKHFGKPKYTPSTHNPKVANYLDLFMVRKRCPSFEKLAKWVTGSAVTPGQQR